MPQHRPGPLLWIVLTLLSTTLSQAGEIPSKDVPPPALERSEPGKAIRPKTPFPPMDVVKWVGALGATILLVRTLRRR